MDGIFCSGGSEANHTALLTALVASFPTFATQGLQALKGQPVFYVSTESHHSFFKAARFCGLGTNNVRRVSVDDRFQLEITCLSRMIQEDRKAGLFPFMVIATAGTTSGGAVDPIVDIAAIAQKEKLWLHVDAAWGGAAIIVPELCDMLSGIAQADSITFDAHKWFSVPMGAGMLLTRHPTILHETCHITTTYMPPDTDASDSKDPYTHSLQWSRRFIGLKLFLSLAVAGWEGYRTALQHQVAMSNLLRKELESTGWKVLSPTRLPIVCFQNKGDAPQEILYDIVNEIVSSGKAWISTTKLNRETLVIRACITNFLTQEEDITALVDTLNTTRQSIRQKRKVVSN